MGIPQVPERVRRAPTLALRAVFAGIGRLVMSADRPEALVAAPESAVATTTWAAETVERDVDHDQPPAQRQQLAADVPLAQASSRWRSLDKTGNVRLLSAKDQADGDSPTAPDVEPVPKVKPAPETKPAPDTEPAAEVMTAAEAAAGHSLPLASYDSLSLASVRARLRGLDVGQLRILLDYEAMNAERPEVLGMFERRIAKLESGG
jgi:hypothetical protein